MRGKLVLFAISFLPFRALPALSVATSKGYGRKNTGNSDPKLGWKHLINTTLDYCQFYYYSMDYARLVWNAGFVRVIQKYGG